MTLSQKITAAIPPSDECDFPLAKHVAQNLMRFKPKEEKALLATALGTDTIFPEA